VGIPARSMPSPPSFSFVTTPLRPVGVSLLKLHSGAARSHAAYWGDHGKDFGSKDQSNEQQDIVIASDSGDGGDGTTSDDREPASDFPDSLTILRQESSRGTDISVIP
jgi:hypothetical protein